MAAVQQVKVWLLRLNPMWGGGEESRLVAVASSEAWLMEWYSQQRAEAPYQDEGPAQFFQGTQQYNKFHKKDGPLEWFNPLEQTMEQYQQGIFPLWIFEETFQDILGKEANWIG